MKLDSLFGDQIDQIPLIDLVKSASDLLKLERNGFKITDPEKRYKTDCFVNEVHHLVEIAKALEYLYNK